MTLLRVAAALSVLLLTSEAGAQTRDPAACIAASEAGIKQRTGHHLQAARAPLLTCADAGCPEEVRTECERQLGLVNAAIPMVVFAATDSKGQSVTDVRVTVDGHLVAERLEGIALPFDPGPHQFVFESAGHPAVTESLVLREGDTHRREVVMFPLAPEPVTPVADAAAAGSISPLQITGLVAGGVGVVGLIVGGILGVMASSRWSTAQSECPSHAGCSPQALSDRDGAASLANGSTIGLVAGAVLAAGGTVLFLVAPRDTSSPTVGVRAGPTGMTLVGSF